MYTFAAIVTIWVFVAFSCHLHYRARETRDPEWWSQREMSLKPFTERQWLWFMSLWPVALVLLIAFLVLMLILGALEHLNRWWESRRVPK